MRALREGIVASSPAVGWSANAVRGAIGHEDSFDSQVLSL
jgi:hypothetical protein